MFVFEGAIRLVAQVRPFTRSYFFGLTQKVTQKVKASSSPFLLQQEFFSFAVLRPVRWSPFLSLLRSYRSFRPGSPHPAALQEPCRPYGQMFYLIIICLNYNSNQILIRVWNINENFSLSMGVTLWSLVWLSQLEWPSYQRLKTSS